VAASRHQALALGRSVMEARVVLSKGGAAACKARGTAPLAGFLLNVFTPLPRDVCQGRAIG
jgi:hypothetical protein